MRSTLKAMTSNAVEWPSERLQLTFLSQSEYQRCVELAEISQAPENLGSSGDGSRWISHASTMWCNEAVINVSQLDTSKQRSPANDFNFGFVTLSCSMRALLHSASSNICDDVARDDSRSAENIHRICGRITSLTEVLDKTFTTSSNLLACTSIILVFMSLHAILHLATSVEQQGVHHYC